MMVAISVEALVASGIGCVTAAGIYLMLRGRTFPVVVGLMLVGYAVNVFIFAMGRLWAAAPPIIGAAPIAADPLPQALVLTAIVIGFATTGFVLELALRSRHETGTDHVDGDPAEADRDRMRERRAVARRDDRPAGLGSKSGSGSNSSNSSNSSSSGSDSGGSSASSKGTDVSDSSESGGSSNSSIQSIESTNGGDSPIGRHGRPGPAAPAPSTDDADRPGAAP